MAIALEGSCAAISQRLDLLAAGCKNCLFLFSRRYSSDTLPSFAFVEYEDRRDADEAYHDMHNKRMGRDDLLKIEVSKAPLGRPVSRLSRRANILIPPSGPAPRPLLRGGSTATSVAVTVVVTVVVIAVTAEGARAAVRLVVARLARVAALETTHLVRTTGVTATATMTATVATRATVPAAPTGMPHDLRNAHLQQLTRSPTASVIVTSRKSAIGIARTVTAATMAPTATTGRVRRPLSKMWRPKMLCSSNMRNHSPR